MHAQLKRLSQRAISIPKIPVLGIGFGLAFPIVWSFVSHQALIYVLWAQLMISIFAFLVLFCLYVIDRGDEDFPPIRPLLNLTPYVILGTLILGAIQFMTT